MPEHNEPSLVGRAGPLDRLERAVRSSIDGRRSAVLVSGEAGIGKTSLVRAVLETSTDDATVVGWGTCWHGEGAPGFWPWMQVFDDIASAVGQERTIAAAGGHRDSLSVLIRDLGAGPPPTDDSERDRLLLLDAAVRWLETLASDRHLVIVIDDLQWADESTLDLLDHLIATPLRAELLVIGAYRHDEIGIDDRGRIATVSSRSDHIHLDGLTVDDVEVLVTTISGAEVARQRAPDLHRRTGGHPLFVTELARLADDGTDDQLPTAVTGAVARRLETLPAPSREVLDAASVLGNRLLPDVLGSVCDEPPATIVRHLDSAIGTGLVRATSDDQFWFTHDLYRETLYGELDHARRVDLHDRIGQALQARHGRGASIVASDVARHFARSITITDPGELIHWARAAAIEERDRLAFTEAAEHLGRARRAVADAGRQLPIEQLIGLLIDEADLRARAGDPETARRLLREAAAFAPGPTQQADLALAMQRLGAKFASRRDETIEQLDAARSAVTGVDLARQAQLTAALARELQHSVSEDRHRAEPLSQEALALGRESGDDETLAACLLARHDALWLPGTGAERAALGHEIAAIGVRLGDTDRRADGLILEANGLLESGSPEFRMVLDRWIELLIARGEPRDRYMVETRRAALALLDGTLDAAEVRIDQASDIGERIHEPDTGNVLMSQRVALANGRRDPAELTELAADAVAWWTGAPVLAHAVAAGALAKAGDLDGAAREVHLVSAAGGWQTETSYLRSVLVGHLAEAAVALGDLELCRQLDDDIAHLTDACGVNGAVVAFAGPFAHSSGILAGALGDRDRADTLLRHSITIARRLGAAVWLRLGEAELASLDSGTTAVQERRVPTRASLVRDGGVWSVGWGEERASVTHVKGIADIATLIRHSGQEVSALQLAGTTSNTASIASTGDDMTDVDALRSYRTRLEELDAERDEAGDDADLGRLERLDDEREQVLAEIRRTTGLGGRIRTNPNDPAERARKAVSARIRDAIRRLDECAPLVAAHLDRSIRTGLRCSYDPVGDDAAIEWDVAL